MATKEEIEIANKTSRSSGAVGAKAIIPSLVKSYLQTLDVNAIRRVKVLDFGAGKDAMHAKSIINSLHKSRGFIINLDAWEFGANSNINHIKGLIYNHYDVVYASNVLNVQSSITMLLETIKTIHACLKNGAMFYCNYPQSPRKMPDYTREQLLYLLQETGFDVTFNKKYLTYICRKLK